MAETDLHLRLEQIQGKLDGIENKLDVVLDMLSARDGRDEHVDKRLGAVEKKQVWYSGAAAAVGAIVAVLVKH